MLTAYQSTSEVGKGNLEHIPWSYIIARHVLESPPEVGDFIGRVEELTRLQGLLDTDRVVLLYGLPGVGKSKLGAKLALGQQEGVVFWYSFWPGINDTVGAVLWRMAVFLAHHGHRQLASTLVDDQVEIEQKLKSICELLEYEHHVLCFDRLEVVDARDKVQTLLRGLYTGLRSSPGMSKAIMMSRIAPSFLAPEDWEPLSGFDFQDACAFLTARSVYLPAQILSELHSQTSGNPRLLAMFATWFHRAGRTDHEVSKFASMPVAYRGIKNHLLESMDRALDVDERTLLVLSSLCDRPLSYKSIRNACRELGLEHVDATMINLVRKNVIRSSQDMVVVSPIVVGFYQRWLALDTALRTHLEGKTGIPAEPNCLGG